MSFIQEELAKPDPHSPRSIFCSIICRSVGLLKDLHNLIHFFLRIGLSNLILSQDEKNIAHRKTPLLNFNAFYDFSIYIFSFVRLDLNLSAFNLNTRVVISCKDGLQVKVMKRIRLPYIYGQYP